MRLEAMKRQGQRSDLTSGPVGPKLSGTRSNEELAKETSDLMDEAVNSGNLAPYPLAFFNAMLYEDPTVVAWREQNEYVVPGLNNCDDDILPLLKNLSDVLGEQLQKEEFVCISRDMLEKLGECVNELWDFCEMSVFSSAIRRWKSDMSDLH